MGEIDVDTGLTCVIDTGLELPYFLIGTQVSLHSVDQVVHLIKGRTVRHGSADT